MNKRQLQLQDYQQEHLTRSLQGLANQPSMTEVSLLPRLQGKTIILKDFKELTPEQLQEFRDMYDETKSIPSTHTNQKHDD